jgi:hypothetical protein
MRIDMCLDLLTRLIRYTNSRLVLSHLKQATIREFYGGMNRLLISSAQLVAAPSRPISFF